MSLRKFQEKRDEAWAEHRERFACDHGETELRRRKVKGGQYHYVRQCLECGDAQSQPFAKAKAIELNGGHEPPDFDDEIKETWERREKESSDLITEAFGTQAFFADYGPYLKSEAWAKRRALVMKRAGGTCEGCGEAAAAEVHHRSYKHVGNEFLFELVALCKPCHDRFHETEAK
jgi:hypothetical protein